MAQRADLLTETSTTLNGSGAYTGTANAVLRVAMRAVN